MSASRMKNAFEVRNQGVAAQEDRSVLVRYMNEALIAEEIWDYNVYVHDELRDEPLIITLADGHGIRRLVEEYLVQAANENADNIFGVSVTHPWALNAQDPLSWASPDMIHAAFMEAVREQMGETAAKLIGERRDKTVQVIDNDGNIIERDNDVLTLAEGFLADALVFNEEETETLSPDELRAGIPMSNLHDAPEFGDHVMIEVSTFDPRYRATKVEDAALTYAQRTYLTFHDKLYAPTLEELGQAQEAISFMQIRRSEGARSGVVTPFSELKSTIPGADQYENPRFESAKSAIDLVGFRRLAKFNGFGKGMEMRRIEMNWGDQFDYQNNRWFRWDNNEKREVVCSTTEEIREAKARMDSVVEALERLDKQGFTIDITQDFATGWIVANYKRGYAEGSVNVLHVDGPLSNPKSKSDEYKRLSHMGQLYSNGVTYNISLEDQKQFSGKIDLSNGPITVDGRSAYELVTEKSAADKTRNKKGVDEHIDNFGNDTKNLVVDGETMYNAMLLSMGLQPKVYLTQDMIDEYALKDNNGNKIAPGLIEFYEEKSVNGEVETKSRELQEGYYFVGDARIYKRVAGMRETYIPLSYRNYASDVPGAQKNGETISLLHTVDSISYAPGYLERAWKDGKSHYSLKTDAPYDRTSVALTSISTRRSFGNVNDLTTVRQGAMYIKQAIVEARHNYRAAIDFEHSVIDQLDKEDGEFIPSPYAETRAMQGRLWSFMKDGTKLPSLGEEDSTYTMGEVNFEEFARFFLDTDTSDASDEEKQTYARREFALLRGDIDWESATDDDMKRPVGARLDAAEDPRTLNLTYESWLVMLNKEDSREARKEFALSYIDEAVDTLVGTILYGQDPNLGELAGQVVGEEYYQLPVYMRASEAEADGLSDEDIRYYLHQSSFIDLSTADFSADFVAKYADHGNFSYNFRDMATALRLCDGNYQKYLNEKDPETLEKIDVDIAIKRKSKIGEAERLIDATVYFEEETANPLNENENQFLKDVGEAIEGALATSGVKPNAVLIDENGIVRWEGEIISSLNVKGQQGMVFENDQIATQKVAGTIGPIFALDDGSRSVDVSFKASQGFSVRPGFMGYYVDPEFNPDRGDRGSRLRAIDEMTLIKERIARTVRDDVMQVFTDSSGIASYLSADSFLNLGSSNSLRGLWRNDIVGERVDRKATEAQIKCGIGQELVDARCAESILLMIDMYEGADPNAYIGVKIDPETNIKSLSEAIGYSALNRAGNQIINISTEEEKGLTDQKNVSKDAAQNIKRVLGKYVLALENGELYLTETEPLPGTTMVRGSDGLLHPEAQSFVQEYWTQNHSSVAIASEVEDIIKEYAPEFTKPEEEQDFERKERFEKGKTAAADAVWDIFQERYGDGFSQMDKDRWHNVFGYDPFSWVLSMNQKYDTWEETMERACNCSVVDQWLRGALQANTMKSCLGIVDEVKVAYAEVEGFNQDDAIVISKEFSERALLSDEFCEPETDEDGNILVDSETGKTLYSTRGLQVGDKCTDGHGNKGVVSIIIDRNKPLEEAANDTERRLIQFFQDNPSLEVVMSPYSSISRENYGSVLEAASEVSDLVLREYERDEMGRVSPDDEGIPYVRDNAIGTISFTIDEHTGPSGLKVYPYSCGRKIGWQMKSILADLGAYDVLEEMSGTAGANFELVHDAWRVMGLELNKNGDMDFCKEFNPDGRGCVALIDPVVKRRDDLWLDGKIHSQKNKEASVAKRTKAANVAAEAALSSLGGKGGYIALPFELKNRGVYCRDEVENADELRHVFGSENRYGAETSTFVARDVNNREVHMLYVSGMASRRNEDAEEASAMLDKVSDYYKRIETHAYMYSDSQARVNNLIEAFSSASIETIEKWCEYPYGVIGEEDPVVTALTEAVLTNIGSLPYKKGEYTNIRNDLGDSKKQESAVKRYNAMKRGMLASVFGQLDTSAKEKDRDFSIDLAEYKKIIDAVHDGAEAKGALGALQRSVEENKVQAQKAWDNIQDYYEGRLFGKDNIVKSRLLKTNAPGMSATSVWVPNPTLDLDEVGIPESVAEELNVKDGEHVLVWRDPCIRDETIRDLRVHVLDDNEMCGVSVHPAVSAGLIGGDFDGDKVGIKKYCKKEARKEGEDKLGIDSCFVNDEAYIIDKNNKVIGCELKLSGSSLDMAVSMAASHALQDRFEDICLRANELEKLDHSSNEYKQERQLLKRDLNAVWHDGLSGQIGQAAVQFGDRAEIVSSLYNACVATGAKGKLSKLLSGVSGYMGVVFKDGVDPEEVLSTAYVNRLTLESGRIAQSMNLEIQDRDDYVRSRLMTYKEAQPNCEAFEKVLDGFNAEEFSEYIDNCMVPGRAYDIVRDAIEVSLDAHITHDDEISGMVAKVYQSALTGLAGVFLQDSTARCGDDDELRQACHKLFGNVSQKTLDWKKNGKEAQEQSVLLTKTMGDIVRGKNRDYDEEKGCWLPKNDPMTPQEAEEKLSLIFDQLEIAYSKDDMRQFVEKFSTNAKNVLNLERELKGKSDAECEAINNKLVFYGLSTSDETERYLDEKFGENGLQRLIFAKDANIVVRWAQEQKCCFEGMFAKATLPDKNRNAKTQEAVEATTKAPLKEPELKPQVWYTVAYNSKNCSFSGIKRVQAVVTDLPEDVAEGGYDLDAAFENLPAGMRSHYRRGHWRHIQHGVGESKTEKVTYVSPTIIQKEKLTDEQIAQLEAISRAEEAAAKRQGFSSISETDNTLAQDAVFADRSTKVDVSSIQTEADDEFVPQCISVEMDEEDLAHMGLSVAKTIEETYQDDFVDTFDASDVGTDEYDGTSKKSWDEPEVA